MHGQLKYAHQTVLWILRMTLPSEAFLADSSSPSSISLKLISFRAVVARSWVRQQFRFSRIFSWVSGEHLPHHEKIRNPSTVSPFRNCITLEMMMGLPSRAPQAYTLASGSRLEMRVSVVAPPPRASNRQSNLYLSMYSLYSFSHPFLVTSTCLAPSVSSISFCSSRWTTFSSGMPSLRHIFISMRPREEAAAVLIMPYLQPVARYRSTKPSTVSGLMMPQAALARGISSSISNISWGVDTLYCTHDPQAGEIKHTRTPTHRLGIQPLASITRPVPSMPQMEGRGRSKQAPSMSSLSEGLMVEASTLMSTSPSLSSGMGTSLTVALPPQVSMTTAF